MTPQTLAAMLRDLNVCYLIDLGPGCGTVALAACIIGIANYGACANEKHMSWLDAIISKMTIAVHTDMTCKPAEVYDKE